MANVDGLYKKCHHQNQRILNLAVSGDEKQLNAKLIQMVERVWEAKGMPIGGLDADVVAEYATRLWTGVKQGYGIDFPDVDWNTPDYAMLQSLRNNVWQFSAAKNYQQLSAISRELLDANGKLRSFSEFRDAASRINIDHTRHLETEYHTAVGGAQMAAKWTEIEADKDLLPFLQFDAVLDGNTTDICRSLHGVIVRFDSPIVKKYYPPNHYRCRLTVRRLADAKETPIEEIAQPEIPKIFQINLGQQRLAFPADHPYFDGLPKDIQTFGSAGYKLDTDRIGKGQVYESGAAYNPKKAKDIRYQIEYQSRLDVANTIADYLDTDVYITPEILNTDWRYPYFFDKTPVAGKLPDFKAGQSYWELESYEGNFNRKKVKRMLSAGASQSDQIIMKLWHDVDTETINTLIQRYFRGEKTKTIKRIIAIGKNNQVLTDYIK